MPAALPLQVDESGDRCRYRVHSELKPQNVYLVDLLAHDGRGECTCKDWQCRCWPAVKEGGKLSCKHLRAARTHFLERLLQTMARTEDTPPRSTVVHGRR